jgi:hypothetical protein
VRTEREFLLRKLIAHEPSAIDLMPQNDQHFEPVQREKRPYKKRAQRESVGSSDASSINKPLGRPPGSFAKKQPNTLPKLPILIDGITLIGLGRIVLDRSAYYSESCIYPVGYKISRMYNGKQILCRIIDNGISPLFEAYLANDPTTCFSGQTTDDVHAELLQAFENFTTPYVLDGDQFFGLKNKRIKEYINMLPNARRLVKIKQEIKQENLTYFDDNAQSYMITSNM